MELQRPRPVYTDAQQIPAYLATSRTWKAYRNRQPTPKVSPAAYYRPPDWRPKFSTAPGIPLYSLDQTDAYHPEPSTLAYFAYYDFFMDAQSRNQLSVWRNGFTKGGWRQVFDYAGQGLIDTHLRGKAVHGVRGGEHSRWFALAVSLRDGHVAPFLAALDALQRLPALLPGVRWFYELDRSEIHGLNLVGLLPRGRRLKELRPWLEETLEEIGLAGVEVYPDPDKPVRLPYSRDAVTVTDEWLNKAGEADLKANVVKFMEYVHDHERQAVPLAQVIEYIKAQRGPQPALEPQGKLSWAKRLHDQGCWLVPLAPDSKKPSQGTSFDVTRPRPGWPAIEEHLRRGGNYGVLAGKLQDGPHAGKFLGLHDWDEQEAHGRWLENIGRRPPRFLVRSTSGGYHYYVLCDSPPPANSSYGHTHDGDEVCSIRTHNQYVVGPGCTVAGKPYTAHGDQISVHGWQECELFMRQAVGFLVPRKKPAPREKPAPEPEPEVPTNVLPPVADGFLSDRDPTQRLQKAEAYIRHCPGSVAGLGTARKYQFAIACKLLGAYKLRLKEALALMLRWGRKSSNQYSDGRYYPWTRREHEGTLRNVARLRKAGRLHKEKNAPGKWKGSLQEARRLVEGLQDVLPDKTHATKSHPTGYRMERQDWETLIALLLYMPAQEGDWQPWKRYYAYYQELGLGRGWVYERFMTVRNFLADLNVLGCVDNRYTPSTPGVTGFPLRWRVNAGRLLELLEACAAHKKDAAGRPGLRSSPPQSVLSYLSSQYRAGCGWRPCRVWMFEPTAGYWHRLLEDFFEGQEGNKAQTG